MRLRRRRRRGAMYFYSRMSSLDFCSAAARYFRASCATLVASSFKQYVILFIIHNYDFARRHRAPTHGALRALGFQPRLDGVLYECVPARQHEHGVALCKLGLRDGAALSVCTSTMAVHRLQQFSHGIRRNHGAHRRSVMKRGFHHVLNPMIGIGIGN